MIGLPPSEAGGDQVSCTPLPLAGAAVRFCGADGKVMPGGVAVGVFVAVAVAVAVGVFVAVGVLVGVGVGPPPPHVANLKLPMRVRQLNCDEPLG